MTEIYVIEAPYQDPMHDLYPQHDVRALSYLAHQRLKLATDRAMKPLVEQAWAARDRKVVWARGYHDVWAKASALRAEGKIVEPRPDDVVNAQAFTDMRVIVWREAFEKLDKDAVWLAALKGQARSEPRDEPNFSLIEWGGL